MQKSCHLTEPLCPYLNEARYFINLRRGLFGLNSGFYSQGETWGHTNFFYHPKSLGVSRGVKI